MRLTSEEVIKSMALCEIHARIEEYAEAGKALVAALKMTNDEASEAFIKRFKR